MLAHICRDYFLGEIPAHYTRDTFKCVYSLVESNALCWCLRARRGWIYCPQYIGNLCCWRAMRVCSQRECSLAKRREMECGRAKNHQSSSNFLTSDYAIYFNIALCASFNQDSPFDGGINVKYKSALRNEILSITFYTDI